MEIPQQLGLDARLSIANKTLAAVSSPEYVQQLGGTIGADPLIGG
jgi:hypothetical protein